jgi:hypothetical protein
MSALAVLSPQKTNVVPGGAVDLTRTGAEALKKADWDRLVAEEMAAQLSFARKVA